MNTKGPIKKVGESLYNVTTARVTKSRVVEFELVTFLLKGHSDKRNLTCWICFGWTFRARSTRQSRNSPATAFRVDTALLVRRNATFKPFQFVPETAFVIVTILQSLGCVYKTIGERDCNCYIGTYCSFGKIMGKCMDWTNFSLYVSRVAFTKPFKTCVKNLNLKCFALKSFKFFQRILYLRSLCQSQFEFFRVMTSAF